MIAPTPPEGSPPARPPSEPNGSSDSPERRDPGELGNEIAELAAHIDAARYRLLVLIRQFAELERWGPGFKGCDHWLSWRIGITLPTAREHVRVALALGKLPLLSAAMERGEISYSRARAITRVATSENEERLVEFALSATAMQLEYLVRAWRKVERLEDEQVRHERRHLTLYADDDGSYVLRGRLDPEVGELFARALDAARSALYREKEERTRLQTSPGQRAADAFGLVAEWALGSSVLPEAVWPDVEAEANESADGDRQPGTRTEGARGCEGNGAGGVGGTGDGRAEAADAAGVAEQDKSERQDAIPPAGAGNHVSAEEAGVARDPELRPELPGDRQADRKADVSAETSDPASPRHDGGTPLPTSPDASAETEDGARGSEKPASRQRSDRKAGTSAETNGKGGSRKAGRAKRTKRPARPRTAHRADRFLVVMHVDQEGVRVAGTGQSTGPRSSHAVLDGKGVGVPDETGRRVACDSSVVVMTHAPDGSVLDVGRKRRTIPPAIRRAVNYRDGGCRFPGCGLRIVDDHHLTHWIDGGETKVSNVAELCRVHHRLVHEGGFRMELLKNGEARFYSPDGRLVPNTAPRARVEGDAEERMRRENDRRGLDIGPWTATPDWHGERLDLHYGLWTLRGQYCEQDGKDQQGDEPEATGPDSDTGRGRSGEDDDEDCSGVAA